MAKPSRDALVARLFADPKNYPYGFSRSGDFSIAESKALAELGCLIAALVDGLIEPQTDEEQGLLAAAFAKKEPETVAEKAWVKYQKRINRPKLGGIYGSSRVVTDDDAVEPEDDIQIELDND
ncbi:DUF413 domain-containing protein [Paraglaciecola aquimarina]|uniref:Macrodomain Ori protein n=1 Tax=Paraglaciecola aquimarina TaxID=1235557 RepID=A0ABU3T1U3_9ALTE|nr:DUF413 domain-containing protein [Paraglaciecola aquimarina]MDU0356245.1 DUF413 domain-containing protein [Paraglaciecola aquimarina]